MIYDFSSTGLRTVSDSLGVVDIMLSQYTWNLTTSVGAVLFETRLCKIVDLVPGDLYCVAIDGRGNPRFGIRLLITRDDSHYVFLNVSSSIVEMFKISGRKNLATSLTYMKINLCLPHV